MHAGNYTLAVIKVFAGGEQYAPSRISSSLAAVAIGTYFPNRLQNSEIGFHATCFTKKYWSAPSCNLIDNKFGRIFSICKRSLTTHEQITFSRQSASFLSAWLTHTAENLVEDSEDIPRLRRLRNQPLSNPPFNAIAHTSFGCAGTLLPK